LDPLLKDAKNALSDYHSFVNFTFQLESDELFTYFCVFVFADNFGFDFVNYKEDMDLDFVMFLIGICSLINEDNVQFVLALVRLIKETKDKKIEMCFNQGFNMSFESMKRTNGAKKLYLIMKYFGLQQKIFPDEFSYTKNLDDITVSLFDFITTKEDYPNHLNIQKVTYFNSEAGEKNSNNDVKNPNHSNNDVKNLPISFSVALYFC
jgi:hypothetical protein